MTNSTTALADHPLATIGNTITTTINYETGKSKAPPLGYKRSATRTIAGFEVEAGTVSHDASASPQAKKLLESMKNFQSSASKLGETLTRQGVTPLAIVPSAFWHNLCQKAGLIRLTPHNDTVHVSNHDVTQQAWHQASLPNKIYSFVVGSPILKASLFACLISWMLFYAFPNEGMAILAILMTCVSLVTIVISAYEAGDSDLEPRHMKTVLRKAIKSHTKTGTLPVLLWPEGKATRNGTNLRIALPQPPVDVQKKLRAAAKTKMDLHVAAVPEAIGFKDDVAAVLLNAEQKRQEAIVEAKRDPIIFLEDGDAVAIVAQFGDFPIEQAVVEEAIRTYMGG
jgi:hypothetical protein